MRFMTTLVMLVVGLTYVPGTAFAKESQAPPYYYRSDPTPAKPAPIKVVKVLEGDLLILRQGAKPAYKVRLLGAEVRGNACLRNGARRDLRAWIKPGRVVWLDPDRRAPSRDEQGHMIADVITKRGNWTIPGTQLAGGWATLPKYRFGDRPIYKRWAERAAYKRKGHYAACVEDFGTKEYPYTVGTAFDLDSWRYEFAATDTDALPEMQAENAAAPGSVVFHGAPAPGWVYVRTSVTVTRIGPDSAQVHSERFSMKRGAAEYDQLGGSSRAGWCGRGAQYLGGQTLSPGQSFTGYLCATVPAPLHSDLDTWLVGTSHFATARLVKVH